MGCSNPHPHCQVGLRAAVPVSTSRGQHAASGSRGRGHSFLLHEQLLPGIDFFIYQCRKMHKDRLRSR